MNLGALRLTLMCIALAMFAIGAFGWLAPLEPYRVRLVSCGLFFWGLSKIF